MHNYIDLLPQELRDELFMYISIYNVMPKLERSINTVDPDYTMNSFYKHYLNRNVLLKRLTYITQLPKSAFIDFINDKNSNNSDTFWTYVEENPLNLYLYALRAHYVNLLIYLHTHPIAGGKYQNLLYSANGIFYQYGISKDSPEIMAFVLEYYPESNKSINFSTALYTAINKNNYNAVKFLLEHGVKAEERFTVLQTSPQIKQLLRDYME